jgi:hypothetical protein
MTPVGNSGNPVARIHSLAPFQEHPARNALICLS